MAREVPDAASASPDEVRRAGDHLGEQVHQRVSEVGGVRLLHSRLAAGLQQDDEGMNLDVHGRQLQHRKLIAFNNTPRFLVLTVITVFYCT